MKTIVIMQPQFFPWRGLFEQIRLADEFVHLDDAQYQKGGLTSRVRIKTIDGSSWLTVPVSRGGKLTIISETEIDYRSEWRAKHARTFASAYARAPHVMRARKILEDVYAERPRTIGDLDITAIERCSAELGLHPLFSRASHAPVDGAKTQRVLGLLQQRDATVYVTGTGALAYLQEPELQRAGIDVRVMAYDRTPYPQLHGEFDPHVSILDTIANLGLDAGESLSSGTTSWTSAIEQVAEKTE